MDIDEFCRRLVVLSELDTLHKALSILWWSTEYGGSPEMTAGEITRAMRDSGLGNPNSTQLAANLKKSSFTLKNKDRFRLKAGSGSDIREWLKPAIDCVMPCVDQERGYLPEAVWKKTRGYMERVCEQLNGCYQYGFLDAAAVMMRRIVETLIIEAYEHLNRDDEIKGPDGNYYMLSGLIDKCLGSNGLALGREAKKALGEIKKTGDRSAHNRKTNAVKTDLDNVATGLRVVVDELVNIADLRHA